MIGLKFGFDFCYITDKKESMETGTRSGLIPIRGANPHGAAYSFNVIPGKKTHTVWGIRQKIKKRQVLGIWLTAVPSASHRKKRE